MTDDLLARIDGLTLCPSCAKSMDQAAWTLYGVCDACAEPPEGRSDAVEHAVSGKRVRNDGGEVPATTVCLCTGLVHVQGCPTRTTPTPADAPAFTPTVTANLGARAQEAAEAFEQAAQAVAAVVADTAGLGTGSPLTSWQRRFLGWMYR